MFAVIFNFIVDQVSAHSALVWAAGSSLIAYLWHKIAGDNQASIEARIQEVAQFALDLARGAVDAGHIDVNALLVVAKKTARDGLARIGIPLNDKMLALLDHELDVLGGELARQHLEAQMHELADDAGGVLDTFESARKRGEANALPITLEPVSELPVDPAPAIPPTSDVVHGPATPPVPPTTPTTPTTP